MRAVTKRTRAARQPNAPRRVRVNFLATVCAVVASLVATPATGQVPAQWSFGDDAFADLWFHGLAVVGFYGFGPFPLYDPDYTRTASAPDPSAESGPTALVSQRAAFLGSFQGDEAFEIFHFVPLYFSGRSSAEALRALKDVAHLPAGAVPGGGDPATSAVASVLTTPGERRTLGAFVDDLADEWTRVVLPRRTRNEAERQQLLREIRRRWTTEWAPALADFLEREGFRTGSVVVVPALGAEGRFVERNPSGTPGPLVVVGAPQGAEGPAAALSSLVRELCFPAVRRAFAPFEGRFADRMDASRASDLTATRCGELLLETHAPAQVAAYRARFKLPPTGSGRAFLSASGDLPEAAGWEGALDKALLRELEIDPDPAGLPSPFSRGMQK